MGLDSEVTGAPNRYRVINVEPGPRPHEVGQVMR